MWRAVEGGGTYATKSKAESERIRRGDRVIFYVRGTRKFHGIFEAASRWHDPTTAGWPYRATNEIDLTEIKSGTVGIRSVAGSLRFVRRGRWVGLHLHGGLANYGRAIADEDYDVIAAHMSVPSTITGPRR